MHQAERACGLTSQMPCTLSPTPRHRHSFSRPSGLYPLNGPWDERAVRRLILEGKLAPRFPGLEEKHKASWSSSACMIGLCVCGSGDRRRLAHMWLVLPNPRSPRCVPTPDVERRYNHNNTTSA